MLKFVDFSAHFSIKNLPNKDTIRKNIISTVNHLHFTSILVIHIDILAFTIWNTPLWYALYSGPVLRRNTYILQVKVQECRHLNGSGINPICFVQLGPIKKRTVKMSATNEPVYNQVNSLSSSSSSLSLDSWGRHCYQTPVLQPGLLIFLLSLSHVLYLLFYVI